MLHGSLRVQDYQLDIQSHAGLAHYPEHGQCPETLMRRAEIARQLAKKPAKRALFSSHGLNSVRPIGLN